MDYWNFIDHAHQHLATEFPEANLEANLTVLALNRAAGAIRYDLESSIHRPQGSSWGAYRFLFVLWHTGALSAHELATLTNMTRTAVSNMAHSLQERGLIAKAPDPNDGRGVILSLTEQGREYIRQLFLTQNARESEWASALSDVEQKLLILLLRKLMAGEKVNAVRERS